MKISDMTFDEVKEYLKSNNTPIVPIETCEQHGCHLPLNNNIPISRIYFQIKREPKLLNLSSRY